MLQCLLLATSKCALMLSQNYFPEPNQHILTFLHPILLSTTGDALISANLDLQFDATSSEAQCRPKFCVGYCSGSQGIVGPNNNGCTPVSPAGTSFLKYRRRPSAYRLVLLRGGTSEHKTPATKVSRTMWNLPHKSLSIILQILKTSAQFLIKSPKLGSGWFHWYFTHF